MRVTSSRALLLAALVAAGVAAPGGAAPQKTPKPRATNPCKGLKPKCPPWIGYYAYVSYKGTEKTTIRENGKVTGEKTRTISWTMRTPEPIKLFHLDDPPTGDIGGFFSGRGSFREEVTSKSFVPCNGTKTLTVTSSFAGETGFAVTLLSSTRLGPNLRNPSPDVFGQYATASDGYTCVINGVEAVVKPTAEAKGSIHQVALLVTSDGKSRSLFSVGNQYGDGIIGPKTAGGSYSSTDTRTGTTVESSWTWTWAFQRPATPRP